MSLTCFSSRFILRSASTSPPSGLVFGRPSVNTTSGSLTASRLAEGDEAAHVRALRGRGRRGWGAVRRGRRPVNTLAGRRRACHRLHYFFRLKLSVGLL